MISLFKIKFLAYWKVWQHWTCIPAFSIQQELNISCLISWDRELLGMLSAASRKGLNYTVMFYLFYKESVGRFLWASFKSLIIVSFYLLLPSAVYWLFFLPYHISKKGKRSLKRVLLAHLSPF